VSTGRSALSARSMKGHGETVHGTNRGSLA
jgi:hypothetical protein